MDNFLRKGDRVSMEATIEDVDDDKLGVLVRFSDKHRAVRMPENRLKLVKARHQKDDLLYLGTEAVIVLATYDDMVWVRRNTGAAETFFAFALTREPTPNPAEPELDLI
jgi:hypothetical protein